MKTLKCPHYIEQTKEVAPFITCETSFSSQVSELVFGVNICEWDFGVEIDSVK